MRIKTDIRNFQPDIFSPPAGKEKHPHADNLPRDGGNGRARDPHMEAQNQQRIQKKIQYRTA